MTASRPSAVDAPGEPPVFAEARACRLCAERFAATASAHAPRPVFQPGPAARICIASQAPGVRAHTSGTPFLDPSGVRLRAWLGVDEATFYDPRRFAILPMGLCFPGHDAKRGDLPPPRICADTWRDRLFAAHPRLTLVLLIGAAAMNWSLGPGRLSDRVARWREILETPRDGPAFFPLPHPSWRNNVWLKARPWFEAEALPALRAAVAEATQDADREGDRR